MRFLKPNRLALVFCLLFLSLTLVSTQSVAAPLQAATARAGRVLEIKVPAPSLKGNLIGAQPEFNASVYLPPSYDSTPATRYPAFYLLHGFLSNNKVWFTNVYQGMNLQTTMDSMIAAGKIREMIIVAPNTFIPRYGGGFYANSSVNGNWEDAIYRDLVQYIDANYRTLATSGSRGIAGHSMGGYGALVLGMKHPDVFSTVYALSPCCTALEADMSAANPVWQKILNLTSSEQLKLRPQAPDEFFTIAFAALGVALSPNPSSPMQADYPFKLSASGVEKNTAVYETWRTRMPAYMVTDHKQDLLKLHGLFIDYGEKEQFAHIVIGAQQFSRALAEQNIPHVFEVYPRGDHGSRLRERFETRLLQFFSEKLEASQK
jgi:S-formylglutathione hydrolase